MNLLFNYLISFDRYIYLKINDFHVNHIEINTSNHFFERLWNEKISRYIEINIYWNVYCMFMECLLKCLLLYSLEDIIRFALLLYMFA